LGSAGTNRAELLKALESVPQAQRRSMEFLVENMPERDLKSLGADFLLRHVALAHEALAEAPWRDALPQDVFLNDVLPYAILNETRDESRARLRELCAPLVKGCKTAGEAAQKINRELFPLIKVKYSTERKRPDQSALESMASGKATCTGLSILLADACRSVAVPARVAGTPMWVNMRGNHTWTEVWDQGWHFVGAAEPDPQGLDRGWFVHDASQARRDVPEHAIFASSFQRTGIEFPLVWAPNIKWVPGVNVTDRYTPKAKAASEGKVRLLVKVLDAPAGKRVVAPVTLTDPADAGFKLQGTSRSETADLNDILPFEVVPGRTYRVLVAAAERTVGRDIQAGTNAQEVVTLTLSDRITVVQPSQVCYAPTPVAKALPRSDVSRLSRVLDAYFKADVAGRAAWKYPAALDRLLLANEPAVRELAWDAYRKAPIHAAARMDFDAKRVRFEQHASPYTVKSVGERPGRGWALFVAMHGGGGAPKHVNDSQWEIMQRYYKDHPEAGGYLYVALRAPNDTWNGFYDNYVYPLVGQLIRQFLLFGDVDPNKVFLMGYSHGGYGAFAIGPKMPDRFAAIHASAAAPTDGETTPRTLRSTVFTAMVGDRDTAYGRIDRDRRFAAEVERLRGDRTDIYPVQVLVKEGFGHTGLPDRDMIPLMYPAVRNPVPGEITWLMTDPVITEFFWLQVPEAAKGREILASFSGNRFVVTAGAGVARVTVYADKRMTDVSKPVDIELNGSTTRHPMKPSLRVLCETLVSRGDPELAFTAKLEIAQNAEGVLKVVPAR
jgi:pimeloyl-ACP methyl ester carboxylesterase